MTTGFMYDSRFLEHDAGRGHPERSERLLSTMAWLERRDWFADLVRVDPAMADPVWIETVHDASYIARAEETCRSGAPFLDVADVGISRQSSDVARLAAGGALAMADRIAAGDVDNGFALSRPPVITPREAWRWGSACSTTWQSPPATCSGPTVWTRF